MFITFPLIIGVSNWKIVTDHRFATPSVCNEIDSWWAERQMQPRKTCHRWNAESCGQSVPACADVSLGTASCQSHEYGPCCICESTDVDCHVAARKSEGQWSRLVAGGIAAANSSDCTNFHDQLLLASSPFFKAKMQ